LITYNTPWFLLDKRNHFCMAFCLFFLLLALSVTCLVAFCHHVFPIWGHIKKFMRVLIVSLSSFFLIWTLSHSNHSTFFQSLPWILCDNQGLVALSKDLNKNSKLLRWIQHDEQSYSFFYSTHLKRLIVGFNFTLPIPKMLWYTNITKLTMALCVVFFCCLKNRSICYDRPNKCTSSWCQYLPAIQQPIIVVNYKSHTPSGKGT